MHKIDGSGHVNNQFVEGNPAIGQAPTVVTAKWLNAVQAELVNVIEGAGIGLNDAVNTQLKQAITAMIADMAGEFNDALTTYQAAINDALAQVKAFQTTAFFPVQQGGGAGQGDNKVRIGWDGTGLKAQVDNTDLGRFIMGTAFDETNLTGAAGHYELPGGLFINWGRSGILGNDGTETIALSKPYANKLLAVTACGHESNSNSDNWGNIYNPPIDTPCTEITVIRGYTSGSGNNGRVGFIAIGY